MVMNIESFLIYTKNNMLSNNSIQEKTGKGETLWTADNWTVGVAECLKRGIDNYEPPNHIYKKWAANIKADAKYKLLTIEVLNKIKDDAKSLLICEVGRGLDILVSQQIKKWKNVYCYDHVDYKKYLIEFFGDGIKFIQEKSINYNLSLLKENCIMIINSKKMGEAMYNKYINCENIIHIIQNGDLLK